MSYTYEPITNYFKPTIWSEDTQFGLVPTHNWTSFKTSIEELSAKCSSGECIKVLILARHGESDHNIIHKQYENWEQVSQPPISSSSPQSLSQPTLQGSTNKKAKKVHTPHDASLAPSGITQALEVASALQREVSHGMPVPERFFVSSLKRTGETCGLEWGWLIPSASIDAGKEGWAEGEDRGCGVRATAIEKLRESLSGGQHNSRSTKSHLKTLFPSFNFPDDMTEMDKMWFPETWDKEDQGKMCARLEHGMSEVMKRSEGCTYVSITSHKTATERLRLVLGMEERIMGLCEMNIIVLKVTEKESDQGTL